MKALLLTTAVAAGLALPAGAQTAGSPFQTEPTSPSVMVSELIGARIYASETDVDADGYLGVQQGWNHIGEVNDVVLGRDGTVDAVLVDIGGFLGMGERHVAVDMASLRFVQDDATEADDWFLVLRADRATLDTAPEWTMSGSQTGGQTGGQTGTSTELGTTGQVGTDPGAAGSAGGQGMTGQVDPGVTGTGTQTPVTGGDNQLGANPEDAGIGAAAPEGYTAVDRNALTTEMLQGANVYDPSDTSIAEVSDLVMSPDGQVTDVVLDVGGFLGIGEKTVALPLDRLTVAQDEGGFVRIWIDMTQEELEALPNHQQ